MNNSHACGQGPTLPMTAVLVVVVVITVTFGAAATGMPVETVIVLTALSGLACTKLLRRLVRVFAHVPQHG